MQVTVPELLATSPFFVNIVSYLGSSSISANEFYSEATGLDTYQTYNPATNYTTLGTIVIQGKNAYENLVSSGSNIGNYPSLDDGTRWLNLGASNRWAMFDLESNTATYVPTADSMTFTIEVRSPSFDTLGFLNLVNVGEIEVELVKDSVVVYSNTVFLSTRPLTTTWFDYFFDPFVSSDASVIFNLPKYTNAQLNVTINALDDILSFSIGSFVYGNSSFLGEVADGAVTDSLNFSVIDVDDFGNTTLRKRKSTNTMEVELLSDETNANTLNKLRKDLNATPAMWTGLDDQTDPYFGNLILLGIYERFTTRLQRPKVFTSLKIREL